MIECLLIKAYFLKNKFNLQQINFIIKEYTDVKYKVTQDDIHLTIQIHDECMFYIKRYYLFDGNILVFGYRIKNNI